MKLYFVYSFILILINSIFVKSDGGVVSAVLQGLFATPSFFKEQNWKFDPDVAARRSREFQEQNGYRSSKLIERLGLGKDGRMAETQFLNEARDNQPNTYYQIVN